MPFVSFTAPKPDEMLNMNRRRNHFVHAGIAANWRKSAWAYASACPRHERPRITGLATIQVDFGTPTKRKRDPHNFYPTVKPIIDGLVDAGWLVDDDEAHVRTLEPRFNQYLKPDTYKVTIIWGDQ